MPSEENDDDLSTRTIRNMGQNQRHHHPDIHHSYLPSTMSDLNPLQERYLKDLLASNAHYDKDVVKVANYYFEAGVKAAKMALSPQDLSIDTYRRPDSGSLLPETGVRIKHIPTGITVHCHDDRSVHKNRVNAMEELQQHVLAHYTGQTLVMHIPV